MCQRSYLSTWYESLDAFSGDMLGYHSFSNLSDLVAIDFGTLGRLNTLAFEIRGNCPLLFHLFRLIDVSFSLERYRILDSEIKIFELFIFQHFLDSI